MNGTAAAMSVGGTVARARLVVIAVLGAAMVLATPKVAMAANAYGQTFVGQQTCLKDCHENTSGGWQVGRYLETSHAKFVSDVQNNPSLLVPSSAKWPSPSMGGGLTFASGDIGWMLGSPGVGHQFITKYRNDASYVLGTGLTLNPIAGPADDWQMPNGISWNTATGMWENSAKVTTRTYFQSCGGCHFLGVTRPSDVDYTLASGATMTHSTETSYAGFGIQCEHCHGTGASGDHYSSGASIVRTTEALDSQVCGQCHVNGTAKEKNYTGGALFGSANGYTPDKKLSDFFDVAGTQYIQSGPADPKPEIPTSDTKFYPNGSNKGMKHSFYNEWQLSAHARSLRWQNGELWSGHAKQSCLPCHSGEAFLNKIGYGSSRFPNDVSSHTSSLATDKLDIECAVCHQVHSSTGEPLGLRLEAEELCATCHNSQGPIGAELAPGATPHHPQREMRNGYGLIGVPAPAERFMGDAECPQCHMPKTKYSLPTHSFKVMTPGNAIAWNVQANGDSCTPCHTSKTREQLQADLDEWEASLDELTEEASVAIAAAKSRPASVTAEGVDLLGSAKTNVGLVAADASKGAHNYPYAKAGLEKATFFARSVGAGFTRFGATGYSTSMRMAMLYGTLEMGDGAPAAGEKIAIYAKPNGATSWTRLGTASAGDDGDFGYYVGPDGTTSYKAVWTVKDNVEVTSAEAKVTLGSSTSATVSASRISLGRSVAIRGAVSPAHGGKTVTLYYKKGSGSWRKLATRTLGTSSAYSYGWRPSARGTYYVKAVFSGDASHNGSTSSTRRVVVR